MNTGSRSAAVTNTAILLVLLTQVLLSISQDFSNETSISECTLNRTLIRGIHNIRMDLTKEVFLIGKFQVLCGLLSKNKTYYFKLNQLYRVFYVRTFSDCDKKNVEVQIGYNSVIQHCTQFISEDNDVKCDSSVFGNFMKVIIDGSKYCNMHVYGVRSSLDLVVKPDKSTSSHFKIYSGFFKVLLKRFPYSDVQQCFHVDQMNKSLSIKMYRQTCSYLKNFVEIYRSFNQMLVEFELKSNCVIKDISFNMMLVKIKTSPESTVSAKNLHFQVDNITEFSVRGIRPGKTDIFLVPGVQCRKLYSVSVSAPTSTHWIIDEIVLFMKFCFKKRFVHSEVLTTQTYYIGSEQNSKNISIVVVTGEHGTDDGVTLTIYATLCTTNVTLDTINNDFLPNASDVFNVSIPDCGSLQYIALYKSLSQKPWDVISIKLHFRRKIFNFIGEPIIPFGTLLNLTKSNIWTVDLYNSNDITNKLIIYFSGIRLVEDCFLSDQIKIPNYEYRYECTVPDDIVELQEVYFRKYKDVPIQSGIQVMLNRSETQLANFTAIGETDITTVKFLLPCSSLLDIKTDIFDSCLKDPYCGSKYNLNFDTVWLLQIETITQSNTILNIIINRKIISFGPFNINDEILEAICTRPSLQIETAYIRMSTKENCEAVKIQLIWIEHLELITSNIYLQNSINYCEWIVTRTKETTMPQSTTDMQTTDTQTKLTKQKIMNTIMNKTTLTNLQYTREKATTSVPGETLNTEVGVMETKDDHSTTTAVSINEGNIQTTRTKETTMPQSTTDMQTTDTQTKLTKQKIMNTIMNKTTLTKLQYTREKATTSVPGETLNTEVGVMETKDDHSTTTAVSINEGNIQTTMVSRSPITISNTTEIIRVTNTTRTVKNVSVEMECLCPCNKHVMKNYTREEFVEKLKKIATELIIPRNTTSKYKRSKISVPDERKSSFYISSIIVSIVAIPFGLIILLDVIPFLKWFSTKLL